METASSVLFTSILCLLIKFTSRESPLKYRKAGLLCPGLALINNKVLVRWGRAGGGGHLVIGTSGKRDAQSCLLPGNCFFFLQVQNGNPSLCPWRSAESLRSQVAGRCQLGRGFLALGKPCTTGSLTGQQRLLWTWTLGALVGRWSLFTDACIPPAAFCCVQSVGIYVFRQVSPNPLIFPFDVLNGIVFKSQFPEVHCSGTHTWWIVLYHLASSNLVGNHFYLFWLVWGL